MSLLAIFLWSTLTGIFLATAAVLILLPSRHEKPATTAASPGSSVSVQILVLGDIGRSPRMQYHALSIASHGGQVHLIGYYESQPHPELLASPNITIHPLANPPKILKSIPFVISGPLKVLWQVETLIRLLGYTTPPTTWLLVQNPPSIPTLAIALLVSVLRNTRLMIDWHNYGWTILAGTKGRKHPFVAISKAYECALGQCAPTANITVTHAMKKQLQAPPYDIQTPIVTLHDRPAAIFQPLNSLTEKATILCRIPEVEAFAEHILANSTKLIVSSTSWTPDEDFSLLLDALVAYAAEATKPVKIITPTTNQLPPILAVITGKGPQKAYYEQRIQDLQKAGRLPNVTILTAWLSMEDYAGLLRCADLGVCLHMSSSGVDLPMKVVDMFGSGIPVAAYSAYESFGELVVEGVNGCGFETGDQLTAILVRLFGTVGGGHEELRVLRQGAIKESERRWNEEWDPVVGRILGLTQ